MHKQTGGDAAWKLLEVAEQHNAVHGALKVHPAQEPGGVHMQTGSDAAWKLLEVAEQHNKVHGALKEEEFR